MKRLTAICCIAAMAVPMTIGITANAVTAHREILLGDIDGNGTVDINDVTLIQRHLAEYDTPYAIGEPIDFEDDAPTQPTTDPTTPAEGDADLADVSLFGGEDNIQLKVWAPDRAYALTCQQVQAFQNAYPSKTFRISVEAMGESDAATELMNEPERAADVFGFPSDLLGRMVEAQVLKPVSPGFVDDVTQTNAEQPVKAATQNGTLYAYPETADNTYFLVYDKSVVSDEQAGKLESVLAACQAKNRQFVMDCSNGFYACSLAFTGGVITDGFEADGYTQKFVDYDENEAVKTLQAFARLMKQYKGTFVSTDPAGISTGFMNKTVGAGVDGVWNRSADQYALGSNLGAAKLPSVNVDGVDRQMRPMCGYKYIGVNPNSKFPRASQMLARYLAGETCQKQRAEQLQWGPTNRNVQNMDCVTGDPVLNAVKEQSAFAVPQVDIASTFWMPMGRLGSLYQEGSTDYSENTARIRRLLRNIISDIRDE